MAAGQGRGWTAGGGGGGGGSGGRSGGGGGGGGGRDGGGSSGGSGSGGGRAGAIQRGGDRAGQTCGKFHTQHRCFSRLDDAWRAEFGDEAECPRWEELLRSGVAIFDLDYDAILATMYALSVSAEGHCYLCVPPDPGIEAGALGAGESALLGTEPVGALHTFTLDSGASCCFFRDSTTLTPLPAPVPVSKGEVVDVLIPWIRAVRLQLRERFHQDLPVQRLHFDRGGEFSFELLREFCRGEGILYSTYGLVSPRRRPRPHCIGRGRLAMHRCSESGAFVPLFAIRLRTSSPPALFPASASPVCPVCAGRVSRPRLPPVPGTHSMTLRPSTAPQRVPLTSPPVSSLPASPDPESDSLRAASPAVTRFLATAVTNPLFESSAASALITELVDFAVACRLDYAASLVVASVSVCPPFVGGECALRTDVLEDRQEEFECFAASVPHLVSMLLALEGDPDALDILTPRSYAEAIEGPYSSQWQATMDAEMASWKSTGTYVDEVPPLGANIVSGMWIFRVKRPPGSPPAFKARYVARGFSQQQGVDFFQTFSPTPKMTTLRVLLHVAPQRDYKLHSLDFSTAFLQGNLHEEIWLRRPPGFTGSFPAGTQWSLRRPIYGLRQAPRKWHDTLRTTLASLGFAPSTADPSLFLRTNTTLPPFYVLVYVDDLVFATADTEALAHVKSELQKRHTCTDLGELTSYLGLRITRDRAQRTITLTQSHMVQQILQHFGFTYSSPQSTPLPTGHSLSAPPSDESVEPSGPYPELVGCLILFSGSVSWRSTRSSSVLSSSCKAEIYAGAMAAQELRWLTYLLTDLGEAPHSPPVLYVDNKAMLALCQEHRLEHRTKHIALRYFLARELQQRGQLRLAYVASQANTADVFTKALQPCHHQRFCTVLGLVPTVPHLLSA
ncbi:unnamed protein product [Closterium sp. NIES-54]